MRNMLIPKVLDIKTKLILMVAFSGLLTLTACSVSVKDKDDGGNSKVDIETPVGGIHVNENADVRDTGLAVYPGARKREKTGHDSKSANVNISSNLFGVKVVAIEYETDDPSGKVLAFYRDQMKKYGHVIECHTSTHGGDISVHTGEHASNEVSCKGDNNGKIVELKVGTESNQHLVSVEPQDKGSNFALVYIQTRGKEGTI
jgi:hypothetical protein